MQGDSKVNILLVDDQPAKLLSYEVMLAGLGENLVKANSAREAFEHLLKLDVAVVLVDVCMPELDGFELARMIREHPRFQQTAIIFISAVQISEMDSLRGYDVGAVDYVPVPVVPDVLRAKVRVFSELYRKSRQLEALNRELELRVAERTSELAAANERLLQSERGRSIALAAGNMGSWKYDYVNDEWGWDEGQDRIFGLRMPPGAQKPRGEDLRSFFLEPEWMRLAVAAAGATPSNNTIQTEVTILRQDGERRYCLIAAAATFGDEGKIQRIDGVTIDITDRKEAERRQALLAREVDHRARNALAIVQSVIRLTRDQPNAQAFREAVEGRVRALAKAHELLSQARWQGGDVQRLAREELAPYLSGIARMKLEGPAIVLSPDRAQTIALVLHELATNAAKYGGLSEPSGTVELSWKVEQGALKLVWLEKVTRAVEPPTRHGVGTRIILASTQAIRGGQAAFDWQTGGLVFTLSMPLESAGTAPPKDMPAENVVPFQTVTVRRVLLVEDEALTGMFMHDLLEELGYDVLGPITSVEQAMEAATKENICAALLDVNLRGEAIDPVAAALVARRVPIALVTGYSGDHIDAAFAGVPVLRKPVAPDAVRVLLQQMLAAEPTAIAATN
jgi:two-component sensor histidine kinase/DNA-binding response OmpR family regulator